MTTGLIKPGESQTLTFVWFSNTSPPNDAPLATLSPPPTLVVTAPDGTLSTPSLTQRGVTEYWDYTLTPDVVGLWTLQARCQDTNVGEQYAPPLALWVQAESLTDISADTDLLPGINARTSAGPITVVSPVDGKGNIRIIRNQTYASAIGTQIVVTVPVPTNPMGGAATFTFAVSGNQVPLAGSVLSYNISAGTADIGLEMSSTQSGDFTANDYSAPTKGNYSLLIALPASEGNLVPIVFVSGTVSIYNAAPTAS